MPTAQKTTRQTRSMRHRKSKAFDWLQSFVKAPQYKTEWDVARTAAFLNLYEAAKHVCRKKHPDHLGACVIRHRFGLLTKKSKPLISVISFMPPKVLASLTSEVPADYPHFTHLSPTQVAALDPSSHDIDTQCAPPPARGIRSFTHTTPQPKRSRSVEHRAQG